MITEALHVSTLRIFEVPSDRSATLSGAIEFHPPHVETRAPFVKFVTRSATSPLRKRFQVTDRSLLKMLLCIPVAKLE